MPRVDGLSGSSTVWFKLRRPSDCSVWPCRAGRPIVLRLSVTLTVCRGSLLLLWPSISSQSSGCAARACAAGASAGASSTTGAGAATAAALPSGLPHRALAPRRARYAFERFQRLERLERRADDVDRIVAAMDLVSTSLMPAASTTARTPPPAITPVPGAAGFSSTREAPNFSRSRAESSCRPAAREIMRLLGRLDALADRIRHLAGLAEADADAPLPSPTTTMVPKLKRRPPLTTLATRLI